MADPTAPQIPNDAPQDVKDFFDCRASQLNWQSGDVTWLGLKVTPSVTFAPGANPGDVNITVGLLGGMVSFTLPASVNAAGELVVDTSSVPDLSEWGIGGRPDIDAAIKRINDWFKHNGKRLKPARLAGGTVVLEKMPIATAPAVIPTTGPVTPVPPKPAPPKTAPGPVPPAAPSPPGGCSLMFLMLLLLVGVISVGGYVGFVYFGGLGQVAVASPTASPSPTPSPSASAAASASPGQSPTASPIASVTPSPAPSVTAPPQIGMFTAVCIRVVHEQVGTFISYLDWVVWWTDFNVVYFEITVIGANDDEPQVLEFDSRSQAYKGLLGLRGTGDKRITSVIAHMSDSSEIDLTQDLIDEFGSDEFTVRFPQEDTFGNCPTE